jgi:hypothetical protein
LLLQTRRGSIRIDEDDENPAPHYSPLRYCGNTALTLFGHRATIKKTTFCTANPTNPAASGSRLETKVPRMAWKRSLFRCFWIVCAVLIAAGCQEQESVRHYLAPKESIPAPPAMRLLAVMVPRGQEVWFFKFLASEKAVAKHEADFDAFVHSVRFKEQEGAVLDFLVPPGWRRQPGPRPRYATLRQGPKNEGLEITITKLGPEAADVRANVDRWRDQLNLPPLDDDAFGKLRNNTTVDGSPATRVDLVGVLREDAAGRKGHPPRERAKREAVPFQYKTPDGWEARPPLEKQNISIPLVFRIRANGEEAEMTALSLPGDGGGLEMNVNRWRRQVGLASRDQAEIRREARTLKVGDKQAVYVDLSGPGTGAAKRILGALLPLDRETWFFTLKGPPQLVAKEQEHFEAFITSLQWEGQAGAAHE